MSLYQYGFVRNKESSSTSEININEERSDSSIIEFEDTGSKKKVLKNKSDNKQFQYSWLTEFQWLRYNTDNKIMYCIYCRNHNIKTTAFGKNGSKNISKKSAIVEHSKLELAIAPDIVSENSTNYINVKSANEFLNSFSDIIYDRLWKNLFDTDFFSIMIDETLFQLTSGDAHTISSVLINLFGKHDGAAVMLGNKSGVARRLLKYCPYLVVNHCVAHKLALACKDASKEIEFYEKAEELVGRIYSFFKKSSSRTQELKNYQELLDCPKYKIKKIYKIRWLSWYEAIKNVCDTLPALIEMLSNDYSEVAVNLYEDLCSWRMIGFFYFLYDILSYLTQLSKFFQKENLQFCDIQPMIEGTIKSIEKEYIHINDIQHFFGANFQNLMVTTNPFNSSPNIGGHLLKFTDEDYDDLLVDICRYSSSIETILPILIKEYLDVFPNIIRLIKIAYTIPFSSVPCERGFSKQNLIKTKNRNNLSIDTLDKLLRVSLEDESNNNQGESVIPLRTHSIYMPYIDQDLQNRWFDFGADTVINTNRHIRLTHDRPSQTGWLWSRLPLTSTNWQVEFEFKIHGNNPTLFGDGMAVWFTTERAKPGPVFGFIDKFEGLGIFFDTYPNAKHSHSFPYVLAMVGDGKTEYDLGNDGKSNEVAGCEADIRGKPVPTKARITYYKNTYLELKLQYKGWDQWEPCFTIPNVTIPNVAYLGFSALTGEVSDNHDIISVTTNNIVSVPPRLHKPTLRNSDPQGSSNWSIFVYILKLIATAIFLGILVLVYRMYKSQSNKRF
ncbi:10681_t:CDS:10 [Entrophospora sp. SA101]|nr:10681_t:CDS:10 [Entrophospora sp. SA101]